MQYNTTILVHVKGLFIIQPV